MNSSNENSYSKDSSEKNMSLNFAITLIVAIITVLYKCNNYIQSNAVNNFLFWAICLVIALCLSILVLLVLFIFFKGFSIESENFTVIHKINNLASAFYQVSFIIFLVLIVVIAGSLSIYYFGIDEQYQEFLAIIIGFTLFFFYFILKMLGYRFEFKFDLKYQLVFCSLLLFELLLIYLLFSHTVQYKKLLLYPFILFIMISLSQKSDDVLSKRSNLKGFKNLISSIKRVIFIFFNQMKGMSVYALICMLSISAFAIIFAIISPFLVSQSHINIEMDDVYDVNESIIYCSLRIFGLNENIGLSLSKIDTNNTTTRIEYLVIEPSPNPMSNGSILFCNYLNNGEYSIYLNMSNHSSGYYKLSTLKGDSNIKQTVKVFYLK